VLYEVTGERPSAFSPDGKTLVRGESNSITLWDAATGKFQKSIAEGQGSPNKLFFKTDGSGPYAIYQDRKIKQLDLASGTLTETGQSFPEDCCGELLSPDSKTLLVPRSDHGAGGKELWDMQSQKAVITIEHCDSDIHVAAFSPDSKYLIVGSCGDHVQLWDIATRQLVRRIPSHEPDYSFPEWRAAAFSPDGSKLALSNDIGEVLIWDLTTPKVLQTLNVPKPSP
jgi:WD40 repeat protein